MSENTESKGTSCHHSSPGKLVQTRAGLVFGPDSGATTKPEQLLNTCICAARAESDVKNDMQSIMQRTCVQFSLLYSPVFSAVILLQNLAHVVFTWF